MCQVSLNNIERFLSYDLKTFETKSKVFMEINVKNIEIAKGTVVKLWQES